MPTENITIKGIQKLAIIVKVNGWRRMERGREEGGEEGGEKRGREKKRREERGRREDKSMNDGRLCFELFCCDKQRRNSF